MSILSRIYSLKKYKFIKTGKDIECLLIVLATLFVFGNLLWVILDYRNLSVHPHLIYDIMPYFTKNGIAFTLRDLIMPFQEMGNPGEYRPRFLTYGISLINIKLQLFFCQYFLVHPTASVSWIFSLFIAPVYLYKVLGNFTDSKQAQIAGIIVYLSSMGFLSGFSTILVPGKVLTGTVLILTIYCMVRIKKMQVDRQLFFEIHSRYRIIIFFIIFFGLFLDEVSFIFFFLMPILFLKLFYQPVWNRKGIYRNIKNIIYFGLPYFLFLLVVLFAVPILTQHFWNYDFSYLPSLFGTSETVAGTKALFWNVCGDFQLVALFKNFMNLFGTAIIPYQISSLVPGIVPGDACHGIFVQKNTVLKILIFLTVFPALFFYIFRNRYRNPFAARLIIIILVFIGMETLLHGRHIPVINGYYYGSCFSVFLSMFVGNLYPLASRHKKIYRNLASIGLFILVIVQANNFNTMNKSWIVGHNGWTKNRYGVAYENWDKRKLQTMFNNSEIKMQYEAPYPTSITHPSPLSRVELHRIYDAWKSGTLQKYLDQSGVSSGAVYLLFYLRNLEISDMNYPHKTNGLN